MLSSASPDKGVQEVADLVVAGVEAMLKKKQEWSALRPQSSPREHR